MSKFEIMNNLKRSFNKTGLKLKKHSPEMLVIGGVVGMVGATVMACKATTKLSAVMEESKQNIETIHNYVEENGFSEKYTEEDSKKDLSIVYIQSAMKVVKLYAPAVLVGTVSVAAVLGGHNILRKRNVALAAAYTAVDKSFKEYRGRVIERFGKELDKELRFNVKAKEFEKTVTNEDGTEEVVKEIANVADPGNLYSDYAKCFDDGCKGWEKDPELNLMFLRRTQDYANERLQRKGYLFLNDVYDMLGIPQTKAGQIVGWVYDEKNPIGDNYVDFGIYDINKEKNREFVNGYERTIWLDFNVDGNILDLI